MDDFDLEDISFSDWDGGFDWDSVPNIDISGVGSIPYDIEDVPFNFDFGSYFDIEDIPFNFDFSNLNLSDLSNVFSDTVSYTPTDELNVLPSDSSSADSGFNSLDNRSPTIIDIGPGASNTDAFDFLSGQATNNVATTIDELIYEMNNPNIDVDIKDDGSKMYVDKTTGKVVGGTDETGRSFTVDSSGAGVYDDTGERTAGTAVTNFGGNLANKADVDALLKYNAAIAEGGYPVLNKDGTVTVKDSSGKDLFKVGNDGKITTPTTTTPTTPTPKPPVTPGKISNNAALLAALLGGLLGLAGTPKTGGAKGYMAGAGAGGSRPLTATRTALSPAGAPGSGGGRRFMTDVKYAAEGGLMDIVSGQPNQNVTFMAKGGVADLQDYINMGMGMNAGDLRKADFLVRSGMPPDSASSNYSKVPDGMARGGVSSLGSYSDGGRMLKGPGDGMSDSIPATIGGKKPARLAEGEFVVPADVVSHLGNGSTDAGADVLYDMMNKVRKARTGTQKQGKQINPSKYVPR